MEFSNASSADVKIYANEGVVQLLFFLKEARETQYWLKLLIESELVNKNKFQPLLDEANEFGEILTFSTKNLKQKL